MNEMIWRPSFKDALVLSKDLLKRHPFVLGALFLLNLKLDLTLEDLFAAPQFGMNDKTLLLLIIGRASWAMIVSVILFILSTLPPAPGKLMAEQRSAQWDKETLVSLAAETFRAMGHVLLWSLLLIIPGIIVYTRLSFVPYIVLYSKEYQAGEVDCLALSKRLAKHVLFRLLFLSIGLALLVFAIQMIPQIDLRFRVLYIRIFTDLTAFWLAVYACCLMRTLFHRLFLKDRGVSL